MTHLILDCDDVLLDWLDGFADWLIREHDHLVRGYPNSGSLASWIGMTDGRTTELVAEFNRSEAFSRLDCSNSTVRFISEVHKAGHPITVLSSCGVEEETIRLREDNLNRAFLGRIGDVVCIPLGECKGPVLAQMRPGVFVEDNYRHACVGADAGHKVFVFRRPYNRRDEAACIRTDLTWIDDWAPVRALVC